MKTLETRKETMGLQQLLQQIGQKGDALLNERLPRVDEDGIYVPLRANTNQTPLLTGLLMSYANESGRGGIFITIMALPVVVPLDLLQLILRSHPRPAERFAMASRPTSMVSIPPRLRSLLPAT